MQEAVTNNTIATNSTPVTPNGPNQFSNRYIPGFGWPQVYDPDAEGLDSYLSRSNFISASPVSLENHLYFSSFPDINHLAKMSENPQSRWQFTNNGQNDAQGWNVAEGVARLTISGDSTDAADASLRTPSKPNVPPSSNNSSPHSGNQLHVATHNHSRNSSTDAASQEPAQSGAPALAPTALKGSPVNELKERPHSFSGGLSSADLRRLQLAGDGGSESSDPLPQQQWPGHLPEGASDKQGEQLSYPSLSNNVVPRNGPIYGTAQGNATGGNQGGPKTWRHPRNFVPQGQGVPSPTAPGYGLQPQHVSHVSLGGTQQVYDMMLPNPEALNPVLNRVQQQNNAFRGAHHHSNSDPSALRDAAAMALLSNIQPFNPTMFPGMGAPPQAMPMYGQYYGGDYTRPSSNAAAAVAQVMAARLQQSQYPGGYPIVSPTPTQVEQPLASPTPSNGTQSGPSANNRKLALYKTELCRSWEEKGSCRYGAKCQFAHGEEELRKVARHPKYKTEICRTFWVSGSCPYGKRCCFIHTELPSSGATAASGGSATTESGPAQSGADGRARSTSTNSDPNDGPVSLLARISKRTQESPPVAPSPVESPTTFANQRPPTGSLRVNTSVDSASMKQNKSAYPTFASNGVLLGKPEYIKPKSPAPVTAGPDLGRHNAARLEIVGYNNQRNNKSTTPPVSTQNNYNGSDDLNYSSSPISGPGQSGNNPPRANGHVRAGSAGNWGSVVRGSHLSSSSFPSPGGDGTVSSPWTTTELTAGPSRLNDKTWA